MPRKDPFTLELSGRSSATKHTSPLTCHDSIYHSRYFPLQLPADPCSSALDNQVRSMTTEISGLSYIVVLRFDPHAPYDVLTVILRQPSITTGMQLLLVDHPRRQANPSRSHFKFSPGSGAGSLRSGPAANLRGKWSRKRSFRSSLRSYAGMATQLSFNVGVLTSSYYWLLVKWLKGNWIYRLLYSAVGWTGRSIDRFADGLAAYVTCPVVLLPCVKLPPISGTRSQATVSLLVPLQYEIVLWARHDLLRTCVGRRQYSCL